MRLIPHLRSLAHRGVLRLDPHVIGIGVFIILTLLTVGLGVFALEKGEPRSFDENLAMSMKAMGDKSPSKGKWMMAVTYLGDGRFLAAAAILGVLWQLLRRKPWLAVAWAVIALGGFGLNEGAKRTIARERPPAAWRDQAVETAPTSFSFPSGHALGSTILFGLIAYTLLLDANRRSVVILVIVNSLVIIGAVGFSRVFLRVHWASDVLAGFLIGGAWLALTLGVLETWRRGWAKVPPDAAESQQLKLK